MNKTSESTHLTPDTDEPAVDESDASNLTDLMLNNGIVVPMKLYQDVRKQIQARILVLSKNRFYTARELCGSDFWSQLSRNEAILAGNCVAGLVENKEVPLERVPGRHEYPFRYRIL